MMGRTHYMLGMLYYILLGIMPMFTVVNFSNNREMIIGILAAAIGAIFPDADSDHSLINSRNPVFRNYNITVNRYKKLLKQVFAFSFFSIFAILIALYIHKYNQNYYTKFSILVIISLIILAINGVKVGEKLYIPILTDGLRAIDSGATRMKKIFMMAIYLSIGVICIYLSRGNIEGIIWGTIFISIAIFPHRTFLHSPEGIILVTIAVKYLEKRLYVPNIAIAFFIGYFSHLYLADIFTNSGVPLSTLPLVLRKIGLHRKLKKHGSYMKVYSILNKKLSIPLIKTGSKLGNVFEALYVFGVAIILVVLVNNRL